jgi:predicted lysophospholipase L1 biosynthesis ABC-type transport system permease subunit
MKKLALYWRYSTRSLARGGQRTLLAIFCVAVGVMAIVALQQVGNAIDGALTTNVRAGNGGDISIRSDINPLSAAQLDTFKKLQSEGIITDYTAISEHDAKSVDSGGNTQLYTLRAVDPSIFPLAGAPIFINPGNGSLSSLLGNTNVVITDNLQSMLNAKLGQTLTVETSDGSTLHVTVAGIIKGTGYFREAQMLVSLTDFMAAPNSAGYPVTYSVVYANVPGDTDANADAAKKIIEQDFPLATVTTTKDALQNQQNNVQQIRYFLQIVGLLALLIGGVGIINTMQVLLRRRQTEIAMLKTAGYRRGDLYALFGFEAGLLGLVGGAVGAAAGYGAGLLVEKIVEQAFFLSLPSGFSWTTTLGGVAIGFFTALIFGLIPIVQAAQIRPLAVLRGVEGTSSAGVLLSIALGILLVALFFALALSILQNFALTLGAVIGAGVFLLVLSLIFTLVVAVISRLPVPERLHWWYVLLILVGLGISAAVTYAVPAFGILFLALTALGIVVVVLPRTWKSNVKMALRNIGRQPGRTVTTMVALFIGVFAIGLILVLGQNIKDKINNAFATNLTYNSIILANSSNKAQVDAELQQISGIQGEVVNTAATISPISIDGVPIAQLLPAQHSGSGQSNVGREEALAYLSSLQGYDLAHNSLPDVKIVKGAQDTQLGVNLTASDASTLHVLMPQRSSFAPLKLRQGDQITFAGPLTKKPITVTIVGFYTAGLSLSGGGMYSDNSVVLTATDGKPFYVYQLKLPADQSQPTLAKIEAAVPSVQTFSVAQLTVVINSLLNDLIIMLTTIASLAMIAGIIIIANAVALAMLERRREIGILKSVGYTSQSVLGGVLVENGTVGFTGALMAMLLVTLALTILGKLVFKTDFGFGIPIVLGMVLATAAVCMVIAALVAWSATRVRPLEVLRYE